MGALLQRAFSLPAKCSKIINIKNE